MSKSNGFMLSSSVQKSALSWLPDTRIWILKHVQPFQAEFVNVVGKRVVLRSAFETCSGLQQLVIEQGMQFVGTRFPDVGEWHVWRETVKGQEYRGIAVDVLCERFGEEVAG